jgi:hypothetical protein
MSFFIRKGWGCCTKKVISFDDFLEIPGCSYGKHTDVDNRPKEAPKQVQKIETI